MSEICRLSEAIADIAGAMRTERRPFFYLVGAGLSAPQVPTSEQLVKEFKQTYEKNQLGAVPRPSGDTGTSAESYSKWFQKAYPNAQQRRNYLKSLIENARVSHANLRLAHLLSAAQSSSQTNTAGEANRLLNLVITPNFDDLLSRALHLLGMPHLRFDRPDSIERLSINADDVQLVHVHGTYRDYDIANLDEEVKRAATSPIREFLNKLLGEKSPLVIGYAGWDSDVIMNAIRRRVEQPPLPYTIYWFCYCKEDLQNLPGWLRVSSDVIFVRPETDEGKLPAQEVLVKLQEALALDHARFTHDPLGVFLTHLRKTLPEPSDSTDADNDTYLFSKRVISLYPNRRATAHDFSILQLASKARKGSTLLVAGRSLVAWADSASELAYLARERNLRFEFLLSTEAAVQAMPDIERVEIMRDRQRVLKRFFELPKEHFTHEKPPR